MTPCGAPHERHRGHFDDRTFQPVRGSRRDRGAQDQADTPPRIVSPQVSGRQIAAGARLDRAGMVAMRRRHGPVRRRRPRQIAARAATTNSGATGKTWLGLTVERTPSLAVYCEDSNDELWRRQRDINLDYGVSNEDLADVHWMPRLGEDNLMMVFGRNGAGELTKFHGTSRLPRWTWSPPCHPRHGRRRVRRERERSKPRAPVRLARARIDRSENQRRGSLCAHPSRAGPIERAKATAVLRAGRIRFARAYSFARRRWNRATSRSERPHSGSAKRRIMPPAMTKSSCAGETA